MNTPPLRWSVEVSAIGQGPTAFSYEANEKELEALKRYAEVEDLTAFQSKIKVRTLDQGKFEVTGKLVARLVQSSVVDLKAVPGFIEESFSVEFWPPELIEAPDQEAPQFDKDDPEPIVGGRLPIGEFLCQLLIVSMDPYPRNEGDIFEWQSSNHDPQASPFAELARLRKPTNQGDA